jgi:hypothetical protein
MTLIAEGTWKARPMSAVLGMSSNGTEQIGVDMMLLEGPNEGERISFYGYFSEAAFDRTIESLQHMGWDGNDLSDLSTIGTADPYIVIAHEEYNGEVSAKVKWVNAAGGVAMKKRMNPAEHLSFAQRMRGKLLAAKQKNGGGKSQPKPNGTTPGGRPGDFVQPPQPASNVQDDEIPF